MAQSIRKEDRELKAKKTVEKKDNPKSEEERRIDKKVVEKKISKDDAKKEVAKETVKRKTGYDVEALANVARKVLETGDSFVHGPVGEAVDAMAQIKGNAVNDMLEKMAGDSEVAKNMVKAGLGPKFLSTGEQGIQHGARTVLRENREAGDAAGMEKMLCDAVNYGKGMSIDEIRALKISPKTLKKNVAELRAEVEPPQIPKHIHSKDKTAREKIEEKKRAKEKLGKNR